MAPPLSLKDLSRAYKSREFWEGRKRKRSTSSSSALHVQQCFVVRKDDEKGGVGMVCNQKISCGDVIVSEKPLLSVQSPGNYDENMVCAKCLTPLGNLRMQLLGTLLQSTTGDGNNNNTHDSTRELLPLLGLDTGPELTDTSLVESCPCGTKWCSSDCRNLGHTEHLLFCCGSPIQLKKRCEGEDGSNNNNNKKQAQCRYRNHAVQSGSQFLLAGQAIGHVMEIVTTSQQQQEWTDEALYWWKEYAHPLWWEIGDARNNDGKERERRKNKCIISNKLLSEALQSYVLDEVHDLDRRDIIIALIHRICTLEHFGEIMGMLQCNVMEAEFLSPKQQFITHLEFILEEEHCNKEDSGSNHGTNEEIDEWKVWIANSSSRKHQLSALSTTSTTSFELCRVPGTAAKSDWSPPLDDTNAASPVLGSGLFPILTLANHDCDPNASIEFLGESNEGSMVALRDISCGEEITITYVPNGDFHHDNDDADEGRFRHFRATRTWLYLNGRDNEGESDSDNEGESDSDSESKDPLDRNFDESEEGCHVEERIENKDNDDGAADGITVNGIEENCEIEEGFREKDENYVVEGSLQSDRAKVLSEYGFNCRCNRCLHEEK